MKKLFNFIGKPKDQLTPEEKKNKAVMTLVGYAVLFLVVMVMGYFVNNEDLNNQNTDNDTLIIEKLEVLKDNNFKTHISLVKDADILLLNIERESLNKELIEKKYRDNVNYYYYNEGIYYEVNDVHTAYIKKDNVNIYNDYDQTFLSIENIIKLLTDETYTTVNEEDYKIARYTIKDTKFLEVYNSINETEYTNEDYFEVIVDVQYYENIEKVIMNLTDFYSSINTVEYDNVTYSMTFEDINDVNIENITVEE